MVKRSRVQSQERRAAAELAEMVPPDSSFHSQTRLRNASRPMARRFGLLALHQLPLDHHLGGDAGMVGARLPQHVAPAHALEADENVLNGVVEGMPHMERARHIGRRNDDGVGLGCLAPVAGGEGPASSHAR